MAGCDLREGARGWPGAKHGAGGGRRGARRRAARAAGAGPGPERRRRLLAGGSPQPRRARPDRRPAGDQRRLTKPIYSSLRTLLTPTGSAHLRLETRSVMAIGIVATKPRIVIQRAASKGIRP